ncbi:MAG: glycoside hydrolase [Bacteroidia bacterium]|nr:glycoside hydrolase [Bacteroidia bacterium]
MKHFVFLLSILLMCGNSLSQSHLPNILIDDEDAFYPPSEPSVAISRINREVIVAGAILNKVYHSDDGGRTWGKQELTSTLGVFGDPCLISDAQGNFYYLHLSDPTQRGWSDPQLLDRIVIQKSEDGGKSWDDGSFMGFNHPKDQDKEWATIDPRNGRIYASWTQFDKYESQSPEDQSNILCARSSRGGKKWKREVLVNDIPGDCRDDDGTTEGAMPAIGPGGEVYLGWAQNGNIYLDKSTNRGKTWGKDIFVANQPGGWNLDIPGVMRSNGMPITLCDLSKGPHRGSVYVNWADQRNGVDDTDIWIAASRDGGKTFSDPIRINDDPAGRQQFFTWMTIDQTTGYLYCVFYDRRNYDDLQTDVYIASSRDGGATWQNVRISHHPFTPSASAFLGDYTNIDAHDGRIAVVWTRMDEYMTSVWASIFDSEELFPIEPE